VTSTATERFRKAPRQLPPHIQEQAREAFEQFRADPAHPSLHFKRVHTTRPIYSARVSLGYRALAVKEQDVWIWFWIGSHADYDHLIGQG
jgi:hypothetical protein